MDGRQKLATLQFAYNAILKYKELKALHLNKIEALSKLVDSHVKQKGPQDALSVGLDKANTVANIIHCTSAVYKILNATGYIGHSKVNMAAKFVSGATDFTSGNEVAHFSEVIANFLANQAGLQNPPEGAYDLLQMLGNLASAD